MEGVIMTRQLKKSICLFICSTILVFFLQTESYAQSSQKIYTVKNGKMYIELGKDISDVDLNNFIHQFNLAELGLKNFIKKNIADSLKVNGWDIIRNDKKAIAIVKPLESPDKINDPGEQFVLSIAKRFPREKDGLVLGFNKFRRPQSFFVKDSLVRFYLSGNLESKRVILAGSFNNFSPTSLSMKKTDSGWIADVILKPGKYWYKFVLDGNWITDPDNQIREGDGEGNTNSVFYKTNTMFRLDGYKDAKKVFLAGTFNNWQKRDIPMYQTSKGWEVPVYLANGTYTYRFAVDGNWVVDPVNPDRMLNNFGEYNSVVRLGKPYLFRLSGFIEARRVILTGTFNSWRKDELFMNKTKTGWELLYTLAEGNYEYRFIVDGNEITDPLNPLVTRKGKQTGNSVLVLGGNHTFRLKGFDNAGSVVLAGDFNNWNPEGLFMKKEGNEWVYTVHLSPGKHTYKYIVDGKWIIDPGNKLWEQNEHGTGNSVIWIESPDRPGMQ